MNKTLIAIIIILVIAIAGFALTKGDSDQAPVESDQDSQRTDKTMDQKAQGENVQAVSSASASYVVQKGWFNKPSEEVTGTTEKVTGYIIYSSENSILEEVNVEIDDQTFATDNSGRDNDVKKMFSSSDDITVKLVDPVEIPEGEFSITIPLEISINGVSQTVDFTVEGNVSADQANAKGSADVTFEQFGLKAPSAAGIYNVANDFTVKFEINTSA